MKLKSFFQKPISFLVIIVFFTLTGFSRAETTTLSVSNNDEISIERYSAKGKHLILWLAPQYGLRESHRAMARILSKNNIEVWQTDILQSLFLTYNTNTLKNIDSNFIVKLIEYAYKVTGKKVILAADSYASINALRGARLWQLKKHKNRYFIGAVLFSPSTYVAIPPLGQLPEYMPIVSASNIPIMIYQAKKHSNISQFEKLKEKLQQHGGIVYSRLVEPDQIRFYERKPNTLVLDKFNVLAKSIKKMLVLLEKHPTPIQTIKIKKLISKQKNRGIDSYLKNYHGDVLAQEINLTDTQGNIFNRTNYKGKVTVINFWATWCTPCVQEIPSLNRLKKKMKGHAFELISINYAEDKETILKFMKNVNVEFPVLLDQNGAFAKKWNVIAYPSTFVIDKNGNIKYGVNAAIEWDDPELIKKLKSLL